MSTVLTPTDAAPGAVDRLVQELEQSWAATITVRRQSKADVGYRDIYVSVDDQPPSILQAGEEMAMTVPPGPHRLKAHNTLFSKTIDFTVGVGEHASFFAENRAGLGTYSMLAFFIGFLGAGPLYLTFKREDLTGA